MFTVHDATWEVRIPMESELLRQLSPKARQIFIREATCDACGKAGDPALVPCSCDDGADHRYYTISVEHWEDIEKIILRTRLKGSPLLKDAVGVDHIEFSLYREDVDQLSSKTKSFLETFAECVNCDESLDLSRSQCSCGFDQENPWDVAVRYISKSAAVRKLRGLHSSHDPSNFMGTYRIDRSDWDRGQGEALLQSDRKKFHQRQRSIVRQTREKSAPGTYSSQDISAMYSAQGGCCYFCDVKLGRLGQPNAYQVDHLQPLARGGANGPSNLALVCATCNQRKRDKPQATFWGIIRRERGKEWTQAKQAQNEASKTLQARTAAADRSQAKRSCR